MSDFLKKQMEARQRAWSEATELLDTVAKENRDLTAEEREKYDRINVDLDERGDLIKSVQAAESREADIAASMRGMEDITRPVETREAVSNDTEILQQLISGERRSYSFQFEKRDVLRTTSNAPVPITFSDAVLSQARLVGPMLDPSVVTVLNTASGEDLVLPSLATFSTALVEGEADLIAESDPSFGKTTLKAFKHAFLIQVSQEFLADSNIDVIGFLGEQAGNAIGFAVNNALTLGTGTVEPNGIVTAASAGKTGGTAVAGVSVVGHFTGDDLIDLVYSLDGAARRLPGFGIMANGSSIGAIRKLKTTDGEYLFAPSLATQANDTVLGYPLIENPAMASVGSGNRSVIAGHLPSYFVRTVGGIDVARSDDFDFAKGLVTLRFQIRVDGNLPQVSHVKRFTGGTA